MIFHRPYLDKMKCQGIIKVSKIHPLDHTCLQNILWQSKLCREVSETAQPIVAGWHWVQEHLLQVLIRNLQNPDGRLLRRLWKITGQTSCGTLSCRRTGRYWLTYWPLWQHTWIGLVVITVATEGRSMREYTVSSKRIGIYLCLLWV